MTLECLQFIRDNNKHLQGHQYQLIQVITRTNVNKTTSVFSKSKRFTATRVKRTCAFLSKIIVQENERDITDV